MSGGTPTGFYFQNPWAERLLAVAVEALPFSVAYMTEVVGGQWALTLMAGTQLVTLGMHLRTCPRKPKQRIRWEKETVSIDYGTDLGTVHKYAMEEVCTGVLHFEWSEDGESWSPLDAFGGPKLPRKQPYHVRVRAEETRSHDASDWVEMKVSITKLVQVVKKGQQFTISRGEALSVLGNQVKREVGEGTICFQGTATKKLERKDSPHKVIVWAGGTTIYRRSEAVEIEVAIQKAPQVVQWAKLAVEITYGTPLREIWGGASIAQGDKSKRILFDTADDAVLGITPEGQLHEVNAWVEETDDFHPSKKAPVKVKVKKAPQVVKWARKDVEIVYGAKLSSIFGEAELVKGDESKSLLFAPDGELVPNVTPEGQPLEVKAWAGESDNHDRSDDAKLEVTVKRAPQVVTWAQKEVQIVYGTKLSSILGGATITVGDKSKDPCFDHDGETVLGAAPGGKSHTVKAWAAKGDNHERSDDADLTVIVNRAPQTITVTRRDVALDYEQVIEAGSFAATCTSGEPVFSADDGKKLDVNRHAIVLEAPETANYQAATLLVSCEVKQIKNVIEWDLVVLRSGQSLSEMPDPTARGGAVIACSYDLNTKLWAGAHTVTLTASDVQNYRETDQHFGVLVSCRTKKEFVKFIATYPVTEDIHNVYHYVNKYSDELLKTLLYRGYDSPQKEQRALEFAFLEAKGEKPTVETVETVEPLEPDNPKAEYIGGAANEPHIHQYGGDFHLKLGSHRYNIVHGGTFYESTYENAMDALGSSTRTEWARARMGNIEWLLTEGGHK